MSFYNYSNELISANRLNDHIPSLGKNSLFKLYSTFRWDSKSEPSQTSEVNFYQSILQNFPTKDFRITNFSQAFYFNRNQPKQNPNFLRIQIAWLLFFWKDFRKPKVFLPIFTVCKPDIIGLTDDFFHPNSNWIGKNRPVIAEAVKLSVFSAWICIVG